MPDEFDQVRTGLHILPDEFDQVRTGLHILPGEFDHVPDEFDQVRAGLHILPGEFDHVRAGLHILLGEFDHVRAGVDRVECRRSAAGAWVEQVEAIEPPGSREHAGIDPVVHLLRPYISSCPASSISWPLSSTPTLES